MCILLNKIKFATFVVRKMQGYGLFAKGKRTGFVALFCSSATRGRKGYLWSCYLFRLRTVSRPNYGLTGARPQPVVCFSAEALSLMSGLSGRLPFLLSIHTPENELRPGSSLKRARRTDPCAFQIAQSPGNTSGSGQSGPPVKQGVSFFSCRGYTK
jgi:hypothetical protein